MAKKILIVGSQGYLGSRLTEYLEVRQYECKGIDTGFFKGGNITKPHDTSTLTMDARFIGEKELEGYTTVVLLAGISNDPFGNLTSDNSGFLSAHSNGAFALFNVSRTE